MGWAYVQIRVCVDACMWVGVRWSEGKVHACTRVRLRAWMRACAACVCGALCPCGPSTRMVGLHEAHCSAHTPTAAEPTVVAHNLRVRGAA